MTPRCEPSSGGQLDFARVNVTVVIGGAEGAGDPPGGIRPSGARLDLMMPEMDGYAIRSRAKQLAEPGIDAIPLLCIAGTLIKRNRPRVEVVPSTASTADYCD
jgi:hypothetical protein